MKNKHTISKKDILVFGWTTESRFRIANETNSLIDIIPFNNHPKQNDDVSKTTTNELAVNKITYNVWWKEILNYIEIINSLFPDNLIYHWTWVSNDLTYPERLWSQEMLEEEYIIVAMGEYHYYDKEYQKVIMNNADVFFDMNKSKPYDNIVDDVKSGKRVILYNYCEKPEQIEFLSKYKFKTRYLFSENYKKRCFEKFITYKKYNTILEETNNAIDDLHTSKTGHQELAHDLIKLIDIDIKSTKKQNETKKSLL